MYDKIKVCDDCGLYHDILSNGHFDTTPGTEVMLYPSREAKSWQEWQRWLVDVGDVMKYYSGMNTDCFWLVRIEIRPADVTDNKAVMQIRYQDGAKDSVPWREVLKMQFASDELQKEYGLGVRKAFVGQMVVVHDDGHDDVALCRSLERDGDTDYLNFSGLDGSDWGVPIGQVRVRRATQEEIVSAAVERCKYVAERNQD